VCAHHGLGLQVAVLLWVQRSPNWLFVAVSCLVVHGVVVWCRLQRDMQYTLHRLFQVLTLLLVSCGSDILTAAGALSSQHV
jgi:hypothetical protein